MPKTAFFALLFLFIPFLFAEEKKSSDVVLKGDYKWLKGEKVRYEEKLTGVFTPNGDGTWDVSFNFKFKNKDHNYVGTATGSLDKGAISGEVKNDGGKGKRSFTFSGDMKDGKISGTHNETTRGKPRPTGIFTLSK